MPLLGIALNEMGRVLLEAVGKSIVLHKISTKFC
jgi:hypothetical protein